MNNLLTIVLSLTISISSMGQTIQLNQTKSTNDFKIKNGTYDIYLNKSDIISAISEIDSKLNTNNTFLLTLIKDNKLTSIDINVVSEKETEFASLLKSNLGVFLLLKGKAAIFTGTNPIKQIVADESPRMVELDGSSRTSFFFSEEGNEIPIFLGDLDSKLRK
ncbi:hypothetical protein [Flavihumibacter cheonanensis]|uniref:hypothetical protein n=1 Tax=Flavihumibacter cheonanensis TaxID=1442385 RepID=UPI001EF8982A|nr:hypothetical protein [Flavihumibacter cheonanensis]MCG7754222.1 hypothetical protein [Flavihumibacter cheonanensis]